MAGKCAPCCPVIRVKCSKRRVRGKYRCVVRMGGQKWTRTPEKAAKKILELKARLTTKGCRGDVAGSLDIRTVRRAMSKALRRKTAREMNAVNPSTSSYFSRETTPRYWSPAPEPAYPGYPGTEE